MKITSCAREDGKRHLFAVPLSRFFVLAIVASLSACAAGPTTSTLDTSTIDANTGARTFAAGFRQIADRYIDPVSVDTLAIEGLNGLDSIDPKFDFKRSDKWLHILYDGQVIRVVEAAAPNDARGWAQLTVNALADARWASPTIRQTNYERVYEAVFDGMLSKLDAFSRYSSAEEARENRARRSGFGGIGIRFHLSGDGATISDVFSAAPAVRGGLRPGDHITHVDDEPLAGLTRRQVRDALRGNIGSRAKITYRRPGMRQFSTTLIERARVVLPTVTRTMRDGIVRLTVSGFNNSTADQLVKNIREAQVNAGGTVTGLILDLRNNPGGLLMQAVKVADLFLVHGRIVATRGRHPNSSREYSAQAQDITNGTPLIVLVNGRSASASEIVASALQDHERALVIGSGSFGKGTVQTITRLPNSGEMTLTWSRFEAPSGYFLHELGVAPTICTSLHNWSAQRLVADAVTHVADVADHLRKWRTTTFEDRKGRLELRQACPRTNEIRDLEVRLADHILTHPALYRRLISTQPTLAAIELR